MNKISATIVCGVFLLSGTMELHARSNQKPRLTRKEKLAHDLREYYVKLDQRLFGERDVKKVERLLRKAGDDEMHRPLVVALLAQYESKMECRPAEGLKLLAPEILGKDKARQWIRKLEDAEARRDAEYNDAVRQAYFDRKPKPEEPTGLALAFPHQQMHVTDLNIDCVLEAARCLMALENIQPALRIIDKVGSRFEGDGRVLAFECLGDLRVKLSMLSQAMNDYKSALHLLKQITPTEGLDHWQKRVQARIKRKIKELQHLLDINAYGPGFVLYRAAETKRRKDKAYGQAILLYDQLIEKFPKSIWEQAGRAYRIKCRLELAKSKERPKSLRQAIAARQKEVDDKERFIRLAKKHKVPKASLEEFEADKAKQEAKVEALQAIPVGEKSLELAKDEARACVKDGVFDLYVGEILVAIGDHSFNQELDPEQADKYYRQAWKWLSKVESVDSSVRTYRIPAKAAKVAQPNQVAVKKDFWGNVERQGHRIGAVINRRTCKWYLNDLRAKAVMAIGFLCFNKEKNDEAIEWYKKTLSYDQKTKKLAAEGKWNDYQRLRWGADHGYLYAYPEELKKFRGRKRFAVLLADFYYCTQRFQKAMDLVDRVLSGSIGRLTRPQAAYLLFLRASSIYWIKKDRKAAFLAHEKVIELNTKGLTHDRAMYEAGRLGKWLTQDELNKRGAMYYKELAYSRRKNIIIWKSKIKYGLDLLRVGKEQEGIKMLRSIRKDSSRWKETAELLIEDYYKNKQGEIQ